MKPKDFYKDRKEKDTPKPRKEGKPSKPWLMEYKWKSEKDYNTCAKSIFFKREYDDQWHNGGWHRYKSAKGVEDSLKKDIRSTFLARYLQGRYWRARNEETGEIIEFNNLEDYYKN